MGDDEEEEEEEEQDDDESEDDIELLSAKKAAKKAVKKAKKAKKKAKKAAKKPKKKKKRVSKIAKGRLAKYMVMKGKKVKTVGGLKAADLTKNKAGKIVSKKASAQGKKNKWIAAVMSARKALNIKGFKGVKKGTPL